MKLIICMNGSNLSVEVSEAVYLALDENRRKAENLYHEKRRHWDARAFDESIIAKEVTITASIWKRRRKRTSEKKSSKRSMKRSRPVPPYSASVFYCTLWTVWSFAEIARQQGCSKYAVRDSVEAVRKKLRKLLMDYPHESPLSGY